MKTSSQKLRMLITGFAGAAVVIVAEVDIDDILTRGVAPSQDDA
jgi:hypothetical protein